MKLDHRTKRTKGYREKLAKAQKATWMIMGLNFHGRKCGQGFTHNIGHALLYVSGWAALKSGFKSARNLFSSIWERITHRPQPKYKNDTFRAACLRHGIDVPGGDRTLNQVKKQLKARKRLNQVLAVISVFFVLRAFSQLNFLMFIMAALATAYSMLQVFNYTFRHWQCEIEKLAGVDDFWVAGGLGRMFFSVKNNKKLTIVFVIAGLYLSPAITFAAQTPNPGIGIYTQAAKGDPSLAMLGQILGGVKGILPGEDTPLTKMFMAFNTSVLAISLCFLMWNMGSGVVQTAHEGEFLGKRYSSIWMPIRNTAGIGGLIPVFGGWSGSQIIMIWATALGVGLGNVVWHMGFDSMLGYVQHPITTPQVVMQDNLMNSIIKSQMCMIGYNADLGTHLVSNFGPNDMERITMNYQKVRQLGPTLKHYTSGGFSDGISLSWGGIGYKSIPMDYCGSVQIPMGTAAKAAAQKRIIFFPGSNSKPLLNSQMVIQAHTVALDEMAKALYPVSFAIYKGNYPNAATLQKIKDSYLQTVGKSLAESVQHVDSNFANYLKTGKGKSWIYAGTIFAKLASVNNEISNAANLQPTVRGPGNVSDSGAQTGINRFLRWQKTGYSATASNSKANGGRAEKGSILKNPAVALDNFRSGVVDAALKALTLSDDDLMTGLIHAGNIILTGSTSALAATWAGLGLAEEGGGIHIFGSGGGGVSGLVTIVGLLATSLFIFLTSIGLMLAVYLPFLPFIIWFGGVLTWAIVVIEAVIAAPLWMFTHMEAEGEGMGNKSSHGYLFLLNVIFRPALMCMALVAAWLMLYVFGGFLKEGLSIMYGSGADDFSGISSIFTFIGVLIVFTLLAHSTVVKCFSLVDLIPNQVFAWVGGHYAGTGGQDAHREAHSVFVAGGQRGGQAAGQAAKKAGRGAGGHTPGSNSITAGEESI